MAEIAETKTGDGTRSFSDRLTLPALVAASGISELGNGLTVLAVPWFVLVTTGSAAQTGLAGAAGAAAVVVAGIFGGALVDRIGFKRASVLSDLASGVTVALIPTLYLLDTLSFWMLIVLVFMGTLLDGPGNAARRAMIPGVVRRAGSTLERANAAMQFSTLTAGDFVAPLAAGVLIGFIGAASVLYVDAATFAVSLLIIAVAIPAAGRFEDTSAETGSSGKSSYFGELREGLRYVFTDSFLSVIMPISIAVNFLISPLFVVAMPVLANDVFGSARAYGLMAAGLGAGAGVGTLLYGAFGHKVKRFTVYWGAIAGVSIGLWLLAFSSELWVAMLATVILGLAAGPVNAVGMVIIQTRVPERMMGRVLGLLYAGSGLATPFGLVVGGVIVEWYGVTTAMVASSIGVTLCAIWIRFGPSLRAVADELEEGRPQ